MTQYQRITGKVFGGNATATGSDPQIAQFGSALAGTFIGTTDPATIQQLPAWGQGWIGAVTPETQFPPMPEMTGAMKVLSHQICGILQQGVSTWDSGTIYYTGNFSSKNGIVYISSTDENQGNDPEIDNTNWKIPYDGQWVGIESTILTTITSGSVTLDLSDILPSDNYAYELLLFDLIGKITNGQLRVQLSSSLIPYSSGTNENFTITRGNNLDGGDGVAIFPVGADKTLTLTLLGIDASGTPIGGHALILCGYRRLGANI